MFSSVVVHNLDLVSITVSPRETHAPLVIDSDAPLTFSIALELFQTVRRWYASWQSSLCYRFLAVRPRDTTEKAAALVAELNRALGPERRLIQALELSDFLRQMAKAGLRSRHPEYSEDDLLRNLTLQFHGEVPRRK